MPLIDINLSEIPDEHPTVLPGVRTFDITDFEEKTSKKGDPQWMVTFTVNDPDSPDAGLRAWDFFNFKYQPAQIKFKRLCRAAGHTAPTVEPSDLIGKTIRAVVKANTFVDNETGETRENTKIADYLFDV